LIFSVQQCEQNHTIHTICAFIRDSFTVRHSSNLDLNVSELEINNSFIITNNNFATHVVV